jgi:hypothetical protein
MVGGSQHTSHSTASAASQTSDEATVTLHNNPRITTPALTGKAFRSPAKIPSFLLCLHASNAARPHLNSGTSGKLLCAGVVSYRVKCRGLQCQHLDDIETRQRS